MNVHTHSPLHTGLDTEGFAHPSRNLENLGIEPGMLVADFGAGSGHYVIEIAGALGNSGRVYAVDVQKDLLRRIHTEANKLGLEERIEFIWGDLESPRGSKIADRHLDLVLISNLLFQVPDKDAVFNEAKRVLKPSGRLAIIDWSESFNSMGPRREDIVKVDQALHLGRTHGFGLTREFAAGAHHYGLILQQGTPHQRHAAHDAVRAQQIPKPPAPVEVKVKVEPEREIQREQAPRRFRLVEVPVEKV